MECAGETATVTVLFTDLVSSTQLMSSLGESAFDELRQPHLALLGQTIAAHGGVEVKSLGDGVMAVFTAASDAVAAAVAMQQAVARHGHRAAARLSMRVGLALGDATTYSGDWFGTPVVQAARLCDQCGGDEILVTDTVRAVAEARTNARFVPVGALALRGLAEVAVWKLDWAQEATPAAVALPDRLHGIEESGFVGRQPELAALRAAFERAATGSRQMLLVGGEPGAGKSRLIAEFAQQVHAEGASVLFGRCDEGLAVPYQPFVEALTHYVHHAPPAEMPSGLGHRGGELARLVPELTELVTGLPSPLRCDPETERYRLFEAIASWLGAASADEVLLVVLDDLHWAAQPTLLALRHVLNDTSPAHLLIVGSYRHTELDPTHSLADLLADLRRVPGVERLTLEGLNEAEVTALLETTGHCRGDHTQALARTIRAHTGGNPFFVGELVRHAAESGVRGRADDGRLEHLGIPEGVHEVVRRRLGRLSAAAQAVLVTAAVVGVEFDLAVVAAVTGLSEEAVADALEEAIAAGLVTEVAGRCRFRHQLLRASLYGSLSITRRRRLHRRVDEAVEALYRSRLDDHLPAALAQLAQDQVAELYTRA